MKKMYLIMICMCSAYLSFAQEWLNNLPKTKSKSELTFFDYQTAFNSYWSKYDVVEGYYFDNGVKTKATGWKQFKRWEYDMKSKINPTTGELPEKTALEVYEAFLVTNPPVKAMDVTANWVSLGANNSTGGYSGIGRINCMAFHPTDNNMYWVGSAGGGVWVTTNNGSSWTCLTDNNGTLSISDIVIPSDYNTSKTIYIATGDKDQSWSSSSIGVLKSTNGGTTWSSTGLTYAVANYSSINKLLLSPTDNQTIIAATSTGVYKTTNGGATWNTQLTSLVFKDLEYKPGNFNTLYGSTSNGKMYVSSNGGASWTQSFTNSNARRIELAVSPNQPTWVFAIVCGTPDGNYPYERLYGIYKSIDNGVTYFQVFSGTTKNLLGYSNTGSDNSGQGSYDLCIAVSPTDANTLIIGGVNSWRSTNGGSAWTLSNHWTGSGAPAVHADKHTHQYRANGDLFEGNDGGIYYSANNGVSWTDKTNGLVISQLYRLGVSATVSAETMTGLQDNGSKLLSSAGWSDVTGGDGMECIIDYSNANIQYSTYVNGKIYKTTNHWGNYSVVSPSAAGSGAWVTPYIIDPVNPQVLYAGYSDVWKTTDRGVSWAKISSLNSGTLDAMAIAPSNNQVLYVSNGYQLWKTTNGGASWSTVTGNLPVTYSYITYIAVKNNDPNTLWVTLGGYNSNKVYESVNGGATWTNISAGLPPIPTYTIVQNKQSTGEVHLYVGTEVGVYFKKGTNNWVPYNTGFPNVKVNELEIYYASNTDNSRLRAATYGRGLWEIPVSVTGTTVVASVVIAQTAGENPTCSGTSVTFTATPTNGGSLPAYQWKVNGVNAGYNSPWFTTSTLTNGQAVTCTMTSNMAGVSNTVVNSQAITMYVNTVQAPTISITQTGGTNPMCSGASATFNASITNGGSSPVYQWKVNGVNVGTNSYVYTSNTLTNGQVVTCSVSSNSTCGVLTATSTGITIYITSSMTLPLAEGFQNSFAPTAWVVANPQTDALVWRQSLSVGNGSTKSAMIDNYTHSATGTIDEMITPKYSFSGVSNPVLRFDVAYARYNASYFDSLIVLASTNCGATWNRVYAKGNLGLATVQGDYTAGIFVPTASQWRTETVNLSAFAGQGSVMVKFQNKAGYGQALYVDNVNIVNATPQYASVAISQVTGSNPMCSGMLATFSASPVNGGSNPIYQWKVNGVNVGTNAPSYSTTSLLNGQVVTCTMTTNLPGVVVSVVTSAGITMTVNSTYSTALPVWEGFQNCTLPSTWTVLNSNNDALVWTQSSTVGNGSTKSVMIDNYSYSSIGTSDDLITSKYSFAGLTSVYLTFDVAYARYDANHYDSLIVFVSTNCGATWTSMYAKGNLGLATVQGDYTAGMFIPTTWQWRREAINLNAFAGQGNVLVKFRNKSGYGQTLYMDNINIYSGTAQQTQAYNTRSLDVEALSNVGYRVYPNPTQNIITITADNEPIKSIKLVDLAGKTMVINELPGMEKEVKMDLSEFASGVYTLQIAFESKTINSQIVIQK